MPNLPCRHAGAVKDYIGTITAAQLPTHGHQVIRLRIQNVMGAKLPGKLLPLGGNLAHDDLLHLLRGQTLHHCQADGAAAEHQHSAVFSQGSIRSLGGVPGDAQRLDEGADVERDVVGQGQDGAGGHDDGVTEPAAAARQADEAAVVAGVFGTAAAGAAGLAVNGRLDGNLLAHAELPLRHLVADLADHARELVAEGDGDGVVGYWVRFGGGEGWPAEIFVQVSAADADVGGCNLGSLVGKRVRRKSVESSSWDAHLDLVGAGGGLRDLLDPDIFLAVVSRSAHHVGIDCTL